MKQLLISIDLNKIPMEEDDKLLREFPETSQLLHNVNDDKLRSKLANYLKISKDEVKEELIWSRAGYTVEQTVNKMLLPQENVDWGSQLDLMRLEKHDTQSNTLYDTKIGLSAIVTDQRLIFIDVTEDHVPILQNKSATQLSKSEQSSARYSILSERNTIEVGHRKTENIYFQPVSFSNIFSIDIDIKDSAHIIYRLRKQFDYIPTLLILAAMIPFLFISLDILLKIAPYFIIGAILSLVYGKFIREIGKIPGKTWSRTVRIGLIDPLTLKKSQWFLYCYPQIEPPILIKWTSKIQEILINYGSFDQTINAVMS